MEEKERYEIHRYTLQGNEKISFNDYVGHICEHYDFGFEKIKPFNQRIQDLLNQQDKRIKELEEYNKISNFWCRKVYEKNQQLKQSLKQQVRKDVIEEVREGLKDMDFLANDTEYGERFSCYSKYKVLDILLKAETK